MMAACSVHGLQLSLTWPLCASLDSAGRMKEGGEGLVQEGPRLWPASPEGLKGVCTCGCLGLGSIGARLAPEPLEAGAAARCCSAGALDAGRTCLGETAEGGSAAQRDRVISDPCPRASNGAVQVRHHTNAVQVKERSERQEEDVGCSIQQTSGRQPQFMEVGAGEQENAAYTHMQVHKNRELQKPLHDLAIACAPTLLQRASHRFWLFGRLKAEPWHQPQPRVFGYWELL